MRKFQATANVQFQLQERQVIAVKSLLLNHDVLAILPTGYRKSSIFHSFVVAKELLNSAKACVLVICPLTSIIQDQIAEAKALGFTCVSLHDLEEVTTVFVDTRLWKTKHPRKRFQNFRHSYVLSTDWIEIHQSQPLV